MPTGHSTVILTGGRVFTQIAEHLRTRISDGEYPTGSILPSEKTLCAEFCVARTTVRRGLAVLEREGLITTIPSKGRVVNGAETNVSYRYQLIADELRDAIIEGRLADVPSEMTLRRRFDASRNTVRQALAVLEREGLIQAEHGKGRFIRHQ
ncbi:GntR family transcriptional regulator [Nonomuraea sp. NPDC050556]|uniref:GntR family transcriptional regulator n=1 Tax=Nonomuraea sp. NPDC050556 TaxID=3364369 RepID=UPI0037BC58A3